MLGSIVGSFLGSKSNKGGGGGGVTDKGYVDAAKVSEAAMTAVAVINTVAGLKIAMRQLDIADKYYRLAKEMRDYWNSTYKPCEAKAVNEACQEPLYEPKYDLMAGRFLASSKLQFKKQTEQIAKTAHRYCTGLTASMMKDLAVLESVAAGDAINLAYRYEEARKQTLDERRWTRRHSMLALGRDMLSTSSSYMGSAANVYDAAMKTISGAGASLINAAAANEARARTRTEVATHRDVPNYGRTDYVTDGGTVTARSSSWYPITDRTHVSPGAAQPNAVLTGGLSSLVSVAPMMNSQAHPYQPHNLSGASPYNIAQQHVAPPGQPTVRSV